MTEASRVRTLIVDDEPLARERIRALLAREPDIEILGEASDGVSAVRKLVEQDFDLLFLDIQMPEMDGFDVLAALDELSREGRASIPALVFVTAHDRYALRAFDVHALDYLLKPFDRERFEKTLARARAQIASERANALNQKLSALVSDTAARRKYSERFMVKSRGRIVFVRADEVDWFEAAGNYVALHAGAKLHLVRGTMSALESRLDPVRFQRVHRSTIVRLDRVRELRAKATGDHELVLRDGTALPLGRTHYRFVRRHLTKLSGDH